MSERPFKVSGGWSGVERGEAGPCLFCDGSGRRADELGLSAGSEMRRMLGDTACRMCRGSGVRSARRRRDGHTSTVEGAAGFEADYGRHPFYPRGGDRPSAEDVT